MATSLAVGQILRTAWYAKDTEQISINTIWWAVSAVGSTPATDQDVIANLDSVNASAFKALLNNNASYLGIVGQIMSAPFPVDVQVSTGGGPGTGGSISLPRQTSGIVSFYTALAGRSQRGRLYLPFPPSLANTADGAPTSAYVTAIGTWLFNFVPTLTVVVSGRSATLTHSIYHRKLHTATATLSYNVRPKWATQRRRGSFGKPNTSPF